MKQLGERPEEASAFKALYEFYQRTQLYTQVSIRKLKQIHAATHPAAKVTACATTPAGSEGDEEPSR